MYRKPGSPGVLKGVLSGPYAGGRKLVSAAKLPRAARQRLADALTGRADPTPILHERPGGAATRFRATWGLLLAIVALATMTAIGFADPGAAWAYQPRGASIVYVLAMILLAVSLLRLRRRRALASGDALVPGRYLLPLDVVEVPPEDAAGDQVIVVTPLGDGRDARIRESGGKSELLIVLDGGADIAFRVRSEREGEHALRRLEHAQTLLEELTYGRELEKAVSNDVFFDIRVDASWESLGPSGPASGARSRRRRSLEGSLGMGVAVLAGAALGWAAFVGRAWASDRALYLRALRGGTTEAFDAYLVRGTSYRDEAVALRERLLAQRAELAKQAAESRSRMRPDFEPASRSEWELTPEEAAARRGSSEACLASMRARASTAHPEVLPIMEALIQRARRTGERVLPVYVHSQIGAPPPGTPASDHEARIARTLWAFERIFSETCPAGLFKFARAPASAARSDMPRLELEVVVSWVPKMPRYAFDVSLHGESASQVASFHLVMPPPETPPVRVRDRSLFVVPSGDGDVHALLSARAFDRLYDELHGLFFRGDPRVPLRDPEDGEKP